MLIRAPSVDGWSRPRDYYKFRKVPACNKHSSPLNPCTSTKKTSVNACARQPARSDRTTGSRPGACKVCASNSAELLAADGHWPLSFRRLEEMTQPPLRLAVLVPVTSRSPIQGLNRARANKFEGEDTHCNVTNILSGLAKLATSLTIRSSPRACATTCRTGAEETPGLDVWPAAADDTCLSAGNQQSPVFVLLGIDADDETLLQHRQQCLDVFDDCGITAGLMMLSGHQPGAVCQIWNNMAAAAVKLYDCQLVVLLGDDTEVSPTGWPDVVTREFQDDPRLMLLLLKDDSDPGFPSFPVLRADRHLKKFGKLLPECFINQGGDPYLAAVYRRWQDCLAMQPDITVLNKLGGVQRSEQPYHPPRYVRSPVSKEFTLTEIRNSTRILQIEADASDVVEVPQWNPNMLTDPASDSCQISSFTSRTSPSAEPCDVETSQSTGVHRGHRDGFEISPEGVESYISSISRSDDCGKIRLLAVDVLVPTFRVNLEILKTMVSAVLESPASQRADLQLILIVDQPYEKLSSTQRAWLKEMQEKWLHKIRVRCNEENLGASATRNKALQESLADFVIFWDDDIIPAPGCLSAYVEAMLEHPEGLGFVGPSFVPKDPSSLWSSAVHQADVLFFWDAAADWRVAQYIPWAVTANVALVNSHHEFDLRFPKTGGGEDIDYCLRVADGKLIPVPEAAVHHPLWNQGRRCYNRFFGWAYGDGALIPLYPQHCYYNWPNSAEACCLLLAAAVLSLSAAVVLGVSTALLLSPSAMFTTAAQSQLVQMAGIGLDVVVSCSYAAAQWGFLFFSAAVGFKTVDLLLDVFRAFHPVRVAKHPCRSRMLHAAAAAEASGIKTWSEIGRLWGQICRRELLSVQRHTQVHVRWFQRFDWFCGLSAAVVRGERRRGFCRFMACCLGAWMGVTVSVLLTSTSSSAKPESGTATATGDAIMMTGWRVSSTVGQLWTAGAVIAGCAVVLWALEF